jgi:tRNA threonylcarbamoyladenosine biosynthesis protein TsaE
MKAACTTQSEGETIELAASIGRGLAAGDVVLLHGELGAGKTRFVMGLAGGIGHESGRVASPTYVLMHHYEKDGLPTLLHVDAYRMGEGDSESLGLDGEMGRGAILVVEWAERMEWDWPERTMRVMLEHAGLDARCITIEYPASCRPQIERAMEKCANYE